MTQLNAEIVVLEHEIVTLKGLRISKDSAVAEAAIKRERALEVELAELRKQVDRQGELQLTPAKAA